MNEGRRPTSLDVARLSGVSRATVSYVLNNDPRQTISAATRSRVLQAANQLGYAPSAAAASLRRGHSRVVVLALDPLFSGHVSDIIVEGATQRLREHGYFVVRHSHENPEAIIDIVRETGPIGVVSLTFLTASIREQLTALGVKRVLDLEVPVGAQGPPDRPWEYPVGQLQVDHLVARGYRKLIYALPENSPRMPIARERLQGAQMEAVTLGIEPLQVIALPLERTPIQRALSALERVPRRTAICAYDDQIAIGVLGAMSGLGWRVREDLAVIGCDDLPVARLVTPALTTLRATAVDVGFAAADGFLLLRDGETRTFDTPQVDLSYEVVIREST